MSKYDTNPDMVRHRILETLKQNSKYLLNPYKGSLGNHCQAVLNHRGCPCRDFQHLRWRPNCPCDELADELEQFGKCTCLLFITEKCGWPDKDIQDAITLTGRVITEGNADDDGS